MNRRRFAPWCVAAALLVALPACTITFRQKPIEPLDPDRNFEAPLDRTWEATREVIAGFGPEIETAEFEDDAGLIVTEFAVFPDAGPDYAQLDSAAYAQGFPFIGGRYTLTVTVREVRGEQTKVRIVPRIEGYLGEEYGYQTLRSTGLLEEELFGRISTELGVPPISER